MAVGSSSVTRGRRTWISKAGLASAVVLAATLLALLIPTVQEVRLTHQCTKLGGQLNQSTEDVEPLVSGRTVYRCVDPGGRVLDTW